MTVEVDVVEVQLIDARGTFIIGEMALETHVEVCGALVPFSAGMGDILRFRRNNNFKTRHCGKPR